MFHIPIKKLNDKPLTTKISEKVLKKVGDLATERKAKVKKIYKRQREQN